MVICPKKLMPVFVLHQAGYKRGGPGRLNSLERIRNWKFRGLAR